MSGVDELICAVEKRRTLYDQSMLDHSDKVVTEKLWQEVAKEVGSNSTECRAKWSVLRNTYSRHLRHISEGSTASNNRKWYLADDMSFLEKHMKTRRCRNSLKNQSQSSDTDETDLKLVNQNTKQEQDQVSNITIKEEVLVDEVDFSQPLTFSDISDDYSTPPAEKSRKTKLDQELQPVLDYFKERTNGMPSSNDSNYKFFESLLPDIQKLSEAKQRHFKLKTLELLYTLLDDGPE